MTQKMNKEEFIKTLQLNHGIIRKVANAYCRNVSDRDDLIQEITIQLWRSWSTYNPDYRLSTWMYRIALNVAISFFRKNYRRIELNKSIQEDPFFIDDAEEGQVEDNIKALYLYISKLSALNKALILLYLDGYSHEEIAKTLGISKTNVSTKIARIKKQLKTMFNQNKLQ